MRKDWSITSRVLDILDMVSSFASVYFSFII